MDGRRAASGAANRGVDCGEGANFFRPLRHPWPAHLACCPFYHQTPTQPSLHQISPRTNRAVQERGSSKCRRHSSRSPRPGPKHPPNRTSILPPLRRRGWTVPADIFLSLWQIAARSDRQQGHQAQEGVARQGAPCPQEAHCGSLRPDREGSRWQGWPLGVATRWKEGQKAV